MSEAPGDRAEREQDAERREESRAAITLKVDYKRLNTFFADYTKNISKGGTFIRTTKPLEIGTVFVFELTLPSDAEPETGTIRLELTGEVKWVVSETDASEDKPAGMGIQFLFKNDAERDRILTFVADLMRSSLGDHLADKLLSGSVD
jgi:type IV pilus assembly protein PilZ